MNMTIAHPYALYTGCALVGFGLLAIMSGAHASYNLDKMKASLTDEAYLWTRFDALDHDNDNCIDLNGFAELLWSLGLEFDDAYTYKAFSKIIGDACYKISF
jgi:Ca2+-binding EF-hand superfamily protein